MRRWPLIAALLFCSTSLFAQTRPASQPGLKPDVANAAYGPHERNVLDLYKAKSDKPTPLLIYIHGGGFIQGDKKSVPPLGKQALDAGISVAAINYRYSTQAPAPAPFADSARAVQFLRSKAKDWNLDPARFAATGGSAGAGISLWLAFHADMADAKSDDPVLRESTRLSCVFVNGAQVSYDPRFIKANIPGGAWKHPALMKLFDLKSGEDENPPADKAKLMEEFAPITHVKADSPPVYLAYSQDRSVPPGNDPNATIHHPKFGDVLKVKMDTLKVECIVKVKGEPMQNPTPIEFLKKYLKVERK